jgi:hypothetical protein
MHTDFWTEKKIIRIWRGGGGHGEGEGGEGRGEIERKNDTLRKLEITKTAFKIGNDFPNKVSLFDDGTLGRAHSLELDL